MPLNPRCDKKQRLVAHLALININAAGRRRALFLKVTDARIAMRTYYFDLKDGVPVRDRQGLEFSSPGGAIAHSKDLARLLRAERRVRNARLTIRVLDESGAEIHLEPVYPKGQ